MKFTSALATLLLSFLLYATVFAQAPTVGTVLKNANLRAGPGTTYAVVGSAKAGQKVNILGQNSDGSWYQLDGKQWIAAFLVDATTGEAVAGQTNASAVVLQSVFFDGEVFQVESDEYAVIANTGTAMANLAGWRLNAGNPGQDFIFPDFALAAGKSCRVYTNEIHAESCGFSFNNGRAIWNNDGDCGYLYDASGNLASTSCYGATSAARTATQRAPVVPPTPIAATEAAPAPTEAIVPATAVPATATPVPPTATPLPAQPAANCDPSYPGVCIPPAPPDLDCADVPYKNFQVLEPDPHRFDREGDGVGCES